MNVAIAASVETTWVGIQGATASEPMAFAASHILVEGKDDVVICDRTSDALDSESDE